MSSLITAAALAAPHVYWTGPHWPWFLFFPLVPLFWILVIWFFVGFVLRRRGGGPWGRPGASAEAVLGERYARGEIDAAEYRARLDVLRGGSAR
jgi:putative membrane protein